MTSGLHVNSKELAHAPRGPGLSADGRLCSRCHHPKPGAGGGFIGTRWYCAACKPPAKGKPVRLSKWITAVHAHCLKTGAGITPAEAEQIFGVPPGQSGSALLNNALRDGWFRREEWKEEGRCGAVRRSRYFALDKEATETSRKGPAPASYFHGVKRVRSVFELGSTL